MNQGKYQKWLILVAFFVVSLFQFGVMKAFGVLIPRFVEQLGISETEAGFGCGIGIAVARLLGPLWGFLTLVTSNRCVTILGGVLAALGFILVSLAVNAIQLYFTMAVVGIGLGLPMVGKVLILKDYFEEDFNMANGLGFTGGAIGMIVLPPLMDFFIIKYGMRGAIVLLSALCANICVAGIVMKPFFPKVKQTGYTKLPEYSRDQEMRESTISDHEESLVNNTPPNDKTPINGLKHVEGISSFCSSTVVNLFGLSTLTKAPVFLIYAASFTSASTAMSGWVLFLFTYSTAIGFNSQLASDLSTIAGIGTLVGRCVTGPLLDKNIISAKMCIVVLDLGGCVSLFLYPFTVSYLGLAVLSFMTGLCTGTKAPVYVTLITDLFHDNMEDFASAIGIRYTASGVGLLCGGPLTGWIFAQTNTWVIPFYTLAGFELLAAILIFVTLIHNMQRPTN